jgi:hypothetical protein
MPEPEGREKREGTALEQAAADHSVDVLIMAAKAGVRPDAAKVAELMKLWAGERVFQVAEAHVEGRVEGAEGGAGAEARVAQLAGVEHAAVQAAVPAVAETDPDLKAKVDELIRRCLTDSDFIGAARGRLSTIMKEVGVKLTLEVGRLVVKSLEESLENKVGLDIISKHVGILHDFAGEVGGGKFTQMKEAPELREKLLRRLLEELPKHTSGVSWDIYFEYVFDRTAGIGGQLPADWLLEKNGFSPYSNGNAKTEAIIKFSLGMKGDETADSEAYLKVKVDEMIRRCIEVENLGPGSRVEGTIMGAMGLEFDSRTGRIVAQSLEESLKKNDSIKIISQKLTILKDFPGDVGGGGFNQMAEAPELRAKILRRLLKELPKYESDAQNNSYFAFITARTLALNSFWQDYMMTRNGLDPKLQGNARTKAIIEWVLANEAKE